MADPRFHPSPEAALLPGARWVYREVEGRGRLHRYVLHRRSSQAFAFNVFGPLDAAARVALLRGLELAALSADQVQFEYEDPANELKEGRGGPRPHVTQVDVLLRGRDEQGSRLAALVEVKFTETGFSGCSAYEHAANPRRDVCATEALFGGDPAACHQLNNKGNGRRRYEEFLAAVPVRRPSLPGTDGGCLVRTGLNQPMRNLALAHVLLARGEADQVVFALAAPSGHQAIWRRFKEVRAVFADTDTCRLVPVSAEDVALLHPDGGRGLERLYPAPVLTHAG